MRVAFVSQWFDPEQASAALPGVIARALASAGHEVHVLTGFPNYPDGELYPGYRLRPYQHEQMGDVHVHRAPLWVGHEPSAVPRAANYLSFAAAASVVALTRFPRVEATWVHSTPATVAVPALVLQRLRGTPFVLHIQDLWPDTVTASGFLAGRRARSVEQLLHRFCDGAYRRASTIAATAPGMVDRLQLRGVPTSKVCFLPNWADEAAFRPLADADLAKRQLGLRGRFTVMYAGNFGGFQALPTVVRAAGLLRSRDDIEFVLVGSGVEESSLRAQVREAGLHNIRFVPPQPFDAMAKVLAAGDVQLISLQDRPLSRITLPSKLQATLAAGRPIIGALSGDAADVVAKSGAGVSVTPGSEEELAAAVVDLAGRPPSELRSMGVAAREHYDTFFRQRLALEQMTCLLERAASGVRR